MLTETSEGKHNRAMGCCNPQTSSPTRPNQRTEDGLVRIPGASVHLTGDGETVELATGDLTVIKITDDGVSLATVVKVGHDLQWPLTKDEPVVKLDQLHYLFSLPGEDGGFLNYGVSFARPHGHLGSFDSFLKENACFSITPSGASKGSSTPSGGVYWRDFAPRVEEYNGLLAKAIAGGTGGVVQGIFRCSDAYSNQVQKGAELIQPPLPGNEKIGVPYAIAGKKGNQRTNAGQNRNGINKSIRGVRKLSEMTEKLSRSLLNGVIAVTGSVSAPIIQSKAGSALLGSVPGQVLLASLDAVNKVLDAVEAAERKSLAATSSAVAGVVSKRFGESAGEVTEDVFATAGHAVGTAWNLFKIRKAVNPSSSVRSAILKNAARRKHN